MKKNNVCSKCGSVEQEDMLKEIREIIYKCKDKDDPKEPGDCTRITRICKGGCQDGESEG